MDIRVLRPGDDGLVAAASHLFDGPARPDATARFLAEAARAIYEGTGGVPETEQVVEVWTFSVRTGVLAVRAPMTRADAGAWARARAQPRPVPSR